MARSLLDAVVRDRAGNVLVGAKVLVYENNTTTPVTDFFAATVGGVAQAYFISNASGRVHGWTTNPRFVRLRVTDNAGAATYADGSSAPFAQFDLDDVPVYENPDDEETDDASLTAVVAGLAAHIPDTTTHGVAAPFALVGWGQGTLAARPDPSLWPGFGYWASNVKRAFVSDGADWWPLDHGNGAINGADYGMTGVNTLDVTTNLQDLINDAQTDNRAVFIPPVDAPSGYHKVIGTIELEDLDIDSGVHIFGLGGPRRGLGQFGGSTEIVNPSNALPIFNMDATAQTNDANPLFLENLSLYGYALNYKGGSGGGGIQARNCSFHAAGTPQCIRAVDTFWWRMYDCAFTARTNPDPAIRMIGENPTVNENITYLFHLAACIFSLGGIRYEQNIDFAPNSNPGMWILDSIDTENLTDLGAGLVEVVRGPGVTDSPSLFSVSARGIRHFDSTGSVRVPIGRSGVGCRFQDWTIAESLYYGAAIVTDGNIPVGIEVVNPARDDPIATDGSGTKLNMLGHKHKTGTDRYLGSSGTPDLYGFAARLGTDADDEWGVTALGVHRWGDGTNPWDVNLYRHAADKLRTDDQFIASSAVFGGTNRFGTEALRVNGEANANTLVLNDGTTTMGFLKGSGSPEGAVVATVGYFYSDVTNGEFYVKKTGTGNTGWKQITHA